MKGFRKLFYLISTPVVYASTINDLADNIVIHMMSVKDLIATSAYVGGVGFLVGSVFKFKQHKDNPTQQPIGNALLYLLLSILLMYLGNIVLPIGETLFGSDVRAGFIT